MYLLLSTVPFWSLCQLYHYELSLPGEFALENLLMPQSFFPAFTVTSLICRITCAHGEASCAEMSISLLF